MQAKINATTSEEAKQQEQLKQKRREQNAEIKNTVTANNAALGSITQLTAQIKLLTAQYNSLSEAERKSTTGTGLKTQIADTQTQLNSLNADLAKHQGQVGNYANQIGQSFKSMGLQLLQYLGIYGAINTVAGFFKGSVDAALEEDKALHRLQGPLII